ncbi:MAG: GGDEF domain-containing protein, partial [Quinella sp. 1Q7]|nr:GGDEF domain-containing protein [Quinella sp. 1Q7]
MAEKNLGTPILLCVAALVMNLFGALIVEAFELPLYLDTSGTIFIAALGGYIPGIAVGFFTNLTKSFVEPSEMYFCSVSVAVAIITTFFARKGMYRKFWDAMLLVPMLTFVTGTCDLLIEGFLKVSDILDPVMEYDLNFAENFLFEFVDKALSIALAYVLLKFVPPHVKNFFRHLGHKQAPLSEDMKRVADERSYLASSLRTKMIAILTLSSLLLSFSVALISYLLFKGAAIDERIKTVDGMIAVAINDINPYRVDDYLKLGRVANGYRATEEKLYAIKNSSLDVKFLYVYRVLEDGCHVVFDMDTATYDADPPGTVVALEDALLKYRDDLLAGRPIPPVITDNEYGYLLTMYKPMYDAAGKCQCYVAIDFSMDILHEYMRTFVIKLIALFLGCFVFIYAIGLAFIENNIILPVNTMAYCAKNFSYDSATAREKYFERLKGLKIHTGDEIENLYSALLRTTENILNYLEHLQRAKVRVADMQVKVAEMDEIAYKDSLTGVQNKAAYDRAIAELDEKISDGDAKFCIVMVDVNYLKRVNDTYGHERGNEYLINACRLVCAIFGEEHVYRIGGDEFVVVIDGEKSSLIK